MSVIDISDFRFINNVKCSDLTTLNVHNYHDDFISNRYMQFAHCIVGKAHHVPQR